MKKLSLILLLAVCAIGGGVALTVSAGDDDPVAGKYKPIKPPQPTDDKEKVEVVEMFWYGCRHCYKFQPFIERWEKSKPEHVAYRRMPAVFSKGWIPHARAFYTAEALGVLDKVHMPLFDAIHKQNKRVDSEEKIQALFAEHGVSKEDFDKMWNSFGVESQVRRSIDMSRRYGLEGVPTVVVNGKYRTSGSIAGTYDDVLKVIDVLAEKEHKAMQN